MELLYQVKSKAHAESGWVDSASRPTIGILTEFLGTPPFHVDPTSTRKVKFRVYPTTLLLEQPYAADCAAGLRHIKHRLEPIHLDFVRPELERLQGAARAGVAG